MNVEELSHTIMKAETSHHRLSASRKTGADREAQLKSKFPKNMKRLYYSSQSRLKSSLPFYAPNFMFSFLKTHTTHTKKNRYKKMGNSTTKPLKTKNTK